MSRAETYESRTEKLAEPILKEKGLELVDVEYVKEAGEWYLRIYADKEGGITIDDCEAVSREVSPLLDQEDFIADAYILEVSSPGLLRPLKKERDYARNLGRPVELRTYKAVNGMKEFVGTLTSYTEDTVTIETEDRQTLTFGKKELSLIRQYVEF